eukprot:COSAG01_NODE_803_length_13459_cov_9.995808_6_plen_173_part_00
MGESQSGHRVVNLPVGSSRDKPSGVGPSGWRSPVGIVPNSATPGMRDAAVERSIAQLYPELVPDDALRMFHPALSSRQISRALRSRSPLQASQRRSSHQNRRRRRGGGGVSSRPRGTEDWRGEPVYHNTSTCVPSPRFPASTFLPPGDCRRPGRRRCCCHRWRADGAAPPQI